MASKKTTAHLGEACFHCGAGIARKERKGQKGINHYKCGSAERYGPPKGQRGGTPAITRARRCRVGKR